MVGTGDTVAPITEVLGHSGAKEWWYPRSSGAGHGARTWWVLGTWCRGVYMTG